MIKITFLAENKTDNPDCMAEHGLSVLVETNEKTILFDTGASDLFARNAEKMNIDLTTVDDVVISHGHYDHTQGVPEFCEINDTAPIYIHKDAFAETYGMENGVMDEEPCSIIWTKEQRQDIKNRLSLTNKVFKLTDDIIISGTIPDVEGCEMPERFFAKTKEGEFIPDDMSHEQFMVVRNRDDEGNNLGLYVFSGCSHKGVIPVINYVKELFPGEKIACLVAGMHLYSAAADVRKRTVNEVINQGVELVMPVHCTGIEAICMLKTAMGQNCVVATAGDSYIF